MAGVKGRSGRKSNANEEYRLSTIEACWKLVREAIENEELDYEYRVELASRHTVKSMPTSIEGGLTASLSVMGTITKNGQNLEFKIGEPVDPPEDTGHTDPPSTDS